MQRVSNNCFHDNIFACMIQRDYLKLWLFFLDVVIELPRTNLWTHYPSLVGYSLFVKWTSLSHTPPIPPSAHTKDHKTWCKQIGLLYQLHASNSIGNNKQNHFVILLRFACFVVDSSLGERHYGTMQSWFEECSQGVKCELWVHFVAEQNEAFPINHCWWVWSLNLPW